MEDDTMANHSSNRFMKSATGIAIGALTCLPLWAQADVYDTSGNWPLHSYDYANTNHNPDETKLDAITAKYLTRAWKTFNDDE